MSVRKACVEGQRVMDVSEAGLCGRLEGDQCLCERPVLRVEG